MKRESFFIVVVDRDRKIFNVLGPMINDNWINQKVVNAQNSKRDVYCFSSHLKTKNEVVDNVLSSSPFIGFSYVEESII
ncbi:hypothetical protein [Geobacillus thermoleovorans]|uniref:hypothetical protein n=1 Tax=Geobacillus thermoleovorans TaxID=33941 RepID=UPI003DA42629